MGVLGAGLGGLQLGTGIGEIVNGDTSQGVLDVASGGLGAASGVMAAAGMACPPLAVAAAAAGLGAYGNKYAEDNGWYGTHTDENGNEVNSSFLGSIGETASAGMDLGRDIAGDNIAGDLLGGAIGGIGGAGQTIMNTGAAIGGGVVRGAEALAGGVESIGSGIADVAGSAASGIGSAVSSVLSW
jgi:hypothetical protein